MERRGKGELRGTQVPDLSEQVNGGRVIWEETLGGVGLCPLTMLPPRLDHTVHRIPPGRNAGVGILSLPPGDLPPRDRTQVSALKAEIL